MTTYIVVLPATQADRMAQVTSALSIFADSEHSIWLLRVQTVEDAIAFNALMIDESIAVSMLKLPDVIVPASTAIPEAPQPDVLMAQALSLDDALRQMG